MLNYDLILLGLSSCNFEEIILLCSHSLATKRRGPEEGLCCSQSRDDTVFNAVKYKTGRELDPGPTLRAETDVVAQKRGRENVMYLLLWGQLIV